MRLILASASPRRRDLLLQIGITPDEIIPADINEDVLRLKGGKQELVRAYVARIAESKAVKIAAHEDDAFILAADTAVSVGTRILPKAEDAKTARDCLRLLSGRSHRVYTGLSLIRPGNLEKPITKIVESRVKLRRLTGEMIEDYIESGEWDGKAGGYGIQGCFSKHIISIIGSYTNIVGLPLYETSNLLSGAGWQPA